MTLTPVQRDVQRDVLTENAYAAALEVQDASNLVAVVRAFTRYIDLIGMHLHDGYMGNYALHQHPIAVLFASKLVAMVPDRYPVPVHACSRGSLRMYVQGLDHAIGHLRTEGEIVGAVINDAILRGRQIVRWFVGTIAMATRCEDLSYFGLAYEACQHGALEDSDRTEEWLNRVIGPD